LSWVYAGSLPSLEDKSRHSAPPEITGDEEEQDLPPYDRGYEDRICCRERKPPSYYWPAANADWLRGWDAADLECKEGES
jgi:ribosome modulation factor